MACILLVHVLSLPTRLQEKKTGTKCPPRKRSRPRGRHLRGVAIPVVLIRARMTRVRVLQSRTPVGGLDRTLHRRVLGAVTPRRALVPFGLQLRRVAVGLLGQAGTRWQRRQAVVEVSIWRALAWHLGPSLRRTRRCLLLVAVTMQNPRRPMAGVPRRSVGA